ncbi:maleylacetoacetate isomerase [Vibrio metschnikovii]|uniref:maleylacetoacetate isomerase n=1 Tax=Vibrio metschnikovii TaxID=28172 RepID=UPI001C3004BD|nr:maleylacetoacetate isomerase [Vibrio metschnikovii]
MSELKLYGYWRSSATYRVRLALEIKQLSYQQFPVDLIAQGGEQHSEVFHQLNASELVPVLVDGDFVLNQSLAIIEYLDDHYPHPRLIPVSGEAKYRVLSLAHDIAMDIHPLNNLRVLQYLSQNLAVDEPKKTQWYQHWIAVGFRAIEEKLTISAGQYCIGDALSLADICLIPQVYNAERFAVDMSPYPNMMRITNTLRERADFHSAAPESCR